ncbi:MAG: hypothetical protein IJL74_01710 [Bacilli bacterium]|nr:hypothetical protein [Bacilli bacterium]
MSEIIYKDKYFQVVQTEEYPNVPGCYTIIEVDNDISADKTKSLAVLEKKIRDKLAELNIDLVGIYKQEKENNLNVIIIPYHIDRLQELNINPDEYQPYIEKYLTSYDNDNSNKAIYYAKEMKEHLEKS